MSTEKEQPEDPGRRRFLGGAATLGLVSVAPGLLLARGAAGVDDTGRPVRWGLLVDTRLCRDDCDACVSACFEEHAIDEPTHGGRDPQWIRKVTVEDPATGNRRHVPTMCQHCDSPPCADVCPTGASFQRKDGIVLVDRHRCIGCRYCMMACPYQARSFVHEPVEGQAPHSPRGKGTVEGCTFCVHRLDAGETEPACVERCRRDGHGAMIFGNLNDPESAIARRLASEGGTRLRADLGLDPGVRYQGLG